MIIRQATEKDAAQLAEIYAPYVRETAVTFEYEAPSAEEFAARIAAVTAEFPFLAAEEDGRISGYAYASHFHERAAYAWSAETSVYVRRGAERGGIGKALYLRLEELLIRQGIQNLNACIAFPNPASIAFHEALGYKTAAHFHLCGYKLGRWWDMIWMEKLVGSHASPPAAVSARR